MALPRLNRPHYRRRSELVFITIRYIFSLSYIYLGEKNFVSIKDKKISNLSAEHHQLARIMEYTRYYQLSCVHCGDELS
jgi:hypothetical protein